MSRRYLVPAADVIEVRSALRLKQSELAKRLGVTRRTVIRGEQRGLEIPYRLGDSPRKAVGEAWHALELEAKAARVTQAADTKRARRQAQNRAAARRYRKRRRVTVARRSRVTPKRPRGARSDKSPTSRPAATIRKGDKSRKILPKKSRRQAGRRRGRK